ncbi:CoA pyrophosphatase [Oerskovia turbata]|uniref:CoA pyrophosphatase n=1 Tax=Oerskovia turbata TaxID=1713 RepID=A0A4Q1KPL8_9CELL|nr:CoA pyrophosphatase [Oerskovia turbata]RXR23188.1 CoA pyrophosphatase [Oerskovia turbata]RXR31928.1 CoA pyrophosphatase [Oerskovia turbata]TGJ97144.1 CoA pyrophosphatase [Actinotalea fermentans ATCC 43279 = JCM 9966 = DSM 3133]
MTVSPSARSARADLAALAQDGAPWPRPWRYAIGTLDESRVRQAAVLVLFGVLDDVAAARDASRTGAAPLPVAADLDVLLLARASTLSHHPGQVSFPGGRLDDTDADLVDAALREAVEETGLDRDGVEVLGTLSPLPLPVSNHLVTPVLGWWARPTPVAVVDSAESAHVFRVPVADLTDPANRRTAVVHRGRDTHKSPAFLVSAEGREHLVWGFTGAILDALLDRLGWAEPWDAARTVEVPI